MATFSTNKKCPKCGIEFEPRNGNQIYCGSRKEKKGCAQLIHQEAYKTSEYASIKKEYAKRPQMRYYAYKFRDKVANRDFLLSFEEFMSFWQQPCSFCGDEIETIGLDRVDSDIGYSMDNVVPCCFICNRMKNSLSTEEFINHIRKILGNL